MSFLRSLFSSKPQPDNVMLGYLEEIKQMSELITQLRAQFAQYGRTIQFLSQTSMELSMSISSFNHKIQRSYLQSQQQGQNPTAHVDLSQDFPIYQHVDIFRTNNIHFRDDIHKHWSKQFVDEVVGMFEHWQKQSEAQQTTIANYHIAREHCYTLQSELQELSEKKHYYASQKRPVPVELQQKLTKAEQEYKKYLNALEAIRNAIYANQNKLLGKNGQLVSFSRAFYALLESQCNFNKYSTALSQSFEPLLESYRRELGIIYSHDHPHYDHIQNQIAHQGENNNNNNNNADQQQQQDGRMSSNQLQLQRRGSLQPVDSSNPNAQQQQEYDQDGNPQQQQQQKPYQSISSLPLPDDISILDITHFIRETANLGGDQSTLSGMDDFLTMYKVGNGNEDDELINPAQVLDQNSNKQPQQNNLHNLTISVAGTRTGENSAHGTDDESNAQGLADFTTDSPRLTSSNLPGLNLTQFPSTPNAKSPQGSPRHQPFQLEKMASVSLASSRKQRQTINPNNNIGGSTPLPASSSQRTPSSRATGPGAVTANGMSLLSLDDATELADNTQQQQQQQQNNNNINLPTNPQQQEQAEDDEDDEDETFKGSVLDELNMLMSPQAPESSTTKPFSFDAPTPRTTQQRASQKPQLYTFNIDNEDEAGNSESQQNIQNPIYITGEDLSASVPTQKIINNQVCLVNQPLYRTIIENMVDEDAILAESDQKFYQQQQQQQNQQDGGDVDGSDYSQYTDKIIDLLQENITQLDAFDLAKQWCTVDLSSSETMYPKSCFYPEQQLEKIHAIYDRLVDLSELYIPSWVVAEVDLDIWSKSHNTQMLLCTLHTLPLCKNIQTHQALPGFPALTQTLEITDVDDRTGAVTTIIRTIPLLRNYGFVFRSISASSTLVVFNYVYHMFVGFIQQLLGPDMDSVLNNIGFLEDLLHNEEKQGDEKEVEISLKRVFYSTQVLHMLITICNAMAEQYGKYQVVNQQQQQQQQNQQRQKQAQVAVDDDDEEVVEEIVVYEDEDEDGEEVEIIYEEEDDADDQTTAQQQHQQQQQDEEEEQQQQNLMNDLFNAEDDEDDDDDDEPNIEVFDPDY